ncbi:MAG: 4-(cytidine 5'-diphospho)-2-C-methyl-D-erythritol kinase [Eubacterium sp.]|nr:4-(cytidine 5'-diphospho)-2-C-methyl-D-erythritol kinase [Eubacterium sp.]
MDNFWINAPAKINLGLDVLRRRDDGYHDVKMIMQNIRLFDKLTLNKTKAPGITLKTNLSFLPTDDSNLVYKSAKLLMDEFDVKTGVEIDLFKRIPVAAGMAGGSSDAAACMIAVNILFDLGLSEEELKKRAVTLGADIPFCIQKGTVLSEGIGEVLTDLPPAPDCNVLIVKPKFHVSTGFVYTNLVLDENSPHPDIDLMIKNIKDGDLESMCKNMGNILETVTIPEYPEIGDIKSKIMEFGALGSLMSGSGPTVFGLFKDEETANKARDYFRTNTNYFAFNTTFYRVKSE